MSLHLSPPHESTLEHLEQPQQRLYSSSQAQKQLKASGREWNCSEWNRKTDGQFLLERRLRYAQLGTECNLHDYARDYMARSTGNGAIGFKRKFYIFTEILNCNSKSAPLRA